MAEVKNRVLIEYEGVVEAEIKDGLLIEYVKTEEQVRDIILKYVKALESEIEVDKAVLVGSYARGCARGGEEIDVLIVSPNFEGISNGLHRKRLLTKKVANVHTLLLPRGAYTPDEYNNRPKELGLTYYKRTGKVIYDKSRN